MDKDNNGLLSITSIILAYARTNWGNVFKKLVKFIF